MGKFQLNIDAIDFCSRFIKHTKKKLVKIQKVCALGAIFFLFGINPQMRFGWWSRTLGFESSCPWDQMTTYVQKRGISDANYLITI
jgi:hypothetical protein